MYMCLCVRVSIYLSITSLNKSQTWHIYGTINKIQYNFYKVLTFKRHVSKFESKRMISLQITRWNDKIEGFENAIFWQCSPGTEHCQKIAVSNPSQAGQRFTWSKTLCNRQKRWKAVIIGDTVTRLSIPIRGRGKSPEEGQRWNLAET